MSLLQRWIRQCLVVCYVVGLLLILSGCAQKAKTIQVGVAQFKTESLAAIEKIDTLRKTELGTTALSQQESSAQFLRLVKNSSAGITNKTLDILLNPLALGTPKSELQWQAFLHNMRQHYITFAATFTSLDKGALFAASAVRETIPLLDKLTTQMTAFAQSIRDHPAEFIRERAALAVALEEVRSKKPYNEATDLRLLEIERQLRQLVAAEQHITKATMEQALKAASLGMELRKLLVNFDKLTVDDIAEGLTTALNLVSAIPGLDLSSLTATTDTLISEIKADSALENAFNTAFAALSTARSGAER